jgi:hypothetical protein
MPRIHPPIPSQHNSLANNSKMGTPLDINKNLRSLFCLPSESSETLASHLAAEHSTTTQIGTWLCPCKHTNQIHNHLVLHPRNPLGTLRCGVCKRTWSESCISTTTFTSPVRTVKFHNPVPRPRDDAPILHASLPLDKGGVLCYICTHDGCGKTWKAKVSRAWLSRKPYSVVFYGSRKECVCGERTFQSDKYTLVELAFGGSAG